MKNHFLMTSVLNFILFLLFMNLLIQSVGQFGWGFFSILIALIATHDFVQGVRLFMVYWSLKDK